MFKQRLYAAFGELVAISFNVLNFILAGNLPPLGSICIVVEERGRYLLIERPKGGLAFPGGFMRWREHPTRTAQREFMEETGLRVQLHDVIGTYSNVSTRFTRLSSLVLAYRGEITGGELRGSIEGHPRWIDEAELRDKLRFPYSCILDDYLEHRKRHAEGILPNSVPRETTEEIL